MLINLRINNFVLIDDVNIDFNKGFSIFTGETGAGKSIILDALMQLLKPRTNYSLIRKNQDKSLIEATFDIENHQEIKAKLLDLGFEDEDILIISKQFNIEQKTICKINHRIVTAQILKDVTSLLIDISTQNESQLLLNRKNQLLLLDNFDYEKISKLKEDFQLAYKDYLNAKNNYEKAALEELNPDELDYLQYQVDEIETHNLIIGEEETAENEVKRMTNSEKITQKINYAFDLFDNQILSNLKQIIKTLDSIHEVDDLKEECNKLNDIYFDLIDINDSIAQKSKNFDYDEYRLNELQSRLFEIKKLQRKYGNTIEDILAKKEQFLNKIAKINNRFDYLDQLQKVQDKALALANEKAELLSRARIDLANNLKLEILDKIKQLSLENARFDILFSKKPISNEGCDEINFVLTTNLGQELRPIEEVASGGELSRVLLALKAVFIKSNIQSTIIFDEIDTGVSGNVASQMAKMMEKISQDVQVIGITHLPQVAVVAKNHYYVSKNIENNTTTTSVSLLSSDERINEIAKLLSGDDITKSAIENAKELLKVA